MTRKSPPIFEKQKKKYEAALFTKQLAIKSESSFQIKQRVGKM